MDRLSSFSWRPKTTLILLGGFTLVVIAIVVAFVAENFKPTTNVQIGGGVYHLWLADTEATRAQGLSGVTDLKVNGGMLFDFKANDKWAIWMKDMEIPIDIVWLNSNKRVVYIEQNAKPEWGEDKVMTPKTPARYVIELPAGTVGKGAIKIGQTAEFKLKGEAQ